MILCKGCVCVIREVRSNLQSGKGGAFRWPAQLTMIDLYLRLITERQISVSTVRGYCALRMTAWKDACPQPEHAPM